MSNQINIKNNEYLVEDLNNSSYIEYKDYPHWDKLIKTITNKILKLLNLFNSNFNLNFN